MTSVYNAIKKLDIGLVSMTFITFIISSVNMRLQKVGICWFYTRVKTLQVGLVYMKDKKGVYFTLDLKR